ncbi:hypothetical protein Tco_0656371 [Tanacetum coccineum]|uniref:Uncharacterized protein n=1 Tax=Tanacetum coccineum TaxID=301880 RepID=A0ABQ4X9V1_9ASTR
MQNLERQLNKETLHEKDSKSALSVIKVQFDKFLHSEAVKPSHYDGRHERENFKDYTQMEAQTFKEKIIQNMDSIEQCIVERAHREQEIQNRLKMLNERKLQIQECKIQEVKALDASPGDKDRSGIVSSTRNDQCLENQSNTSGDESSRTLGESNRTRDRYLVALHDKEVELAKYKTFKERTIENDTLERKLREIQAVLDQKEHDIKEGLKLKAYEISVVKEKHDELVKHSLLTKSRYEGLLKEKNTVIKDLKLKEDNDLEKLILMEKQLNFLNEIIYKRNHLIRTIHLLAPKGSTYNGRPTFANPMYLKKAQSEKPCLYEIPYETYDLANIFAPDKKETLTLKQESRSKLNKYLVKPYNYTKQNNVYEIFKPPSREYLDQFVHANEVRKKMWRKSFVKTKPNIVQNIRFLPIGKSLSKSRQAYNVMTNNINYFKLIVDQAWERHTFDKFYAPTIEDMTSLLKYYLMPLALKILKQMVFSGR